MLRLQLQQRDAEINILVSMLNKNGGAEGNGAPAIGMGGASTMGGATGSGAGVSLLAGSGGVAGPPRGNQQRLDAAAAEQKLEAQKQAGRERAQRGVEALGASGTEEAQLLLARNEAFESFRRSYRKNQMMEQNKAELKQKFDEAKALGERVNSARGSINALKGKVEAVRRSRAISEVTGGDGGESGEEAQLMAQMEQEKRTYKEGAGRLRELKAEIEHLQHILAQSRRRLQQDFEGWYAAKCNTPSEAAGAPPQHASPRGQPSVERRQGGPPLTGDAKVDAEILAFYQAREALVQQRMGAR